MFVASTLFNYATGASSSNIADSSTSGKNKANLDPKNARVKRNPKRPSRSRNSPNGASVQGGDVPETGGSPPPSYASVAADAPSPSGETGSGAGAGGEARRAKIAVIDEILAQDDLYKLLNVGKKAKTDEIRRGFLNRSRLCHPDKFPDYPPSTLAFQKISFAYETLSKPSSRRIYDVSGRSDLAASMQNGAAGDGGAFGGGAHGVNEETLNGVLYSVFCEFMEGDFEMVRVMINALNEGNPGLDLGDDAVENLEGAFRRMRAVIMAGKKYLSIIRFELIRLYEIQHSLRQLSYFDVFGRLRLTLQLARVTLSIPMAIDQAMRDPTEGELGAESAEGVDVEGIRESSAREEHSGSGGSSEESSSDNDHRDTAGDSDTEVSEEEEPQFDANAASDSRSGEAPAASNGHHHRRRRHHKHAGRPVNGHHKNNGTNGHSRGSRDTTPRPRSHGAGGEAEFGMAADEADSDDSDAQRKLEKQHKRERRALRRARRKARRRGHLQEARSSNGGDEETSPGHQRQDSSTSQREKSSDKQQHDEKSKRGLLGPAGRGLLKGVVTILETSENWVPGGGKNDHDD